MKEAMMDVDGMEQVERHGQAVKRFRSLCDMHRVPCGAAGSLDELIASIREDRHFAMDFWALVGDLSARERGSLNDDEMLDVIVEGVAGMDAASVPHGQRAKLEELKQLLAGVDVGLPADLPEAIAEPEDALLSARQRAAPPRISRPGVPVVVLPEKTSSAVKVGARVRLAATDDAVDALVARRSIGEALSRLERTSTELREQLAAIDEQLDQQMSKATAEAEELHEEESAENEEVTATEAADEIAALESLRRAQESSLQERKEAAVAEPERTAWRRAAAPVRTPAEPEAEETRAVGRREAEVFPRRAAHTLSQRGFAVPEENDDPSIAVPLSGYASESDEGGRGGRRLAVAAVVLAVVAAAGYFFVRTDAGQQAAAKIGPTLREQYDAVAEKLAALKREATPKQNDGATAAPSNPPSNPTASNDAAATTTPATTAQPSTTADAHAALNAAHSAEPPQARQNGNQTAQRSSPTAVVPQRMDSRDGAREATRSADVAAEPAGEGLVDDADTVKVAPSVMEANLIASRVPAYPEYAKAEGIEGPVVMEAVISRSGGVDHVRVIEGDRHLRSAAEEAVLKWRYRPYYLNGRPVNVATVVRVDFRLHGTSHY